MTCRPVRPLAAARAVCALLLLSTLGFSGCASPASPTFGTVSAEGLAGTWTLQILQQAGGPAIAAPSEASYSLTFSGNRVSALADCNTCSGSFTIVGDAVTISPVLACTRALCKTAPFEQLYTVMLAGESRVGVSGKLMVLNSARGQLRFTK
ncbi:MAG: META domain-containing protein [Acidobacteria bacterium]|nr:META domain-containing protein [Acidobacteriota bacterium]